MSSLKLDLPIIEHPDADPLAALHPSEGSSRRPRPLPMTMAEARERGWNELDVVFVTGDAYIDHPSFAMAILGRVLEAAGFRVGIVSQPDWHSCDAWRTFGKPRLFFAISAGNMDSMINHYTANRKVRNDDAYSPGGRIGLRPDRATLGYCQRAREAYSGVPVIAGSVEASLRRLAHYDYWSDKVRRSILLDAKPDLVAFGMGEETILEMARRLDAGQTVRPARHARYRVRAGRERKHRTLRRLRDVSSPKGRRDRGIPHAAQLRGRRRRQADLRRGHEAHPQRNESVQRSRADSVSR